MNAEVGSYTILVFNAVIGIMLLLALRCIQKFYSSVCLERKIDIAHIIMWSLTCILAWKNMMVRSEMFNVSDRRDEFGWALVPLALLWEVSILLNIQLASSQTWSISRKA